jgi:release factor glutamine methyltransferase
MIRMLATQLPGETASFDAQILLAHITDHNRAWLLSHPEEKLTIQQELLLQRAVQQLQDGVPLPYVLGHWEFFGLDFIVNPRVLIPRPETELLIETALAQVRSHPLIDYRILDIGTGSGIIPISLAVHVPQADLVAIDISPTALKVAERNAEKHGVSDRIKFIEANLVPSDLDLNRFDIICANLPYIPSETLINLEIFGKEPTLALDGGSDGLDLIRNLLEILTAARLEDCLILLEIEQRQGAVVSNLAREAFPRAEYIRIHRDLAGFDRLAVINLSNN